jgi:hypothetical protein
MTDKIRNTINRFANGYVFTADDFTVEVGKQMYVFLPKMMLQGYSLKWLNNL